MNAEYEIVIKPGGEVEAKLVQEATVQSAACVSIQTLMTSLGTVRQHEQGGGECQPVNLNLHIPGSGSGN